MAGLRGEPFIKDREVKFGMPTVKAQAETESARPTIGHPLPAATARFDGPHAGLAGDLALSRTAAQASSRSSASEAELMQ